MIKAIGRRPDGGKVVALGMSRQNLTSMQRGEPISIVVGDEEPDEVILFAAQDECLMREHLEIAGVEIHELVHSEPWLADMAYDEIVASEEAIAAGIVFGGAAYLESLRGASAPAEWVNDLEVVVMRVWEILTGPFSADTRIERALTVLRDTQ